MTKSIAILGIDISKESFDAFGEALGHKRFANTPEGFRSFYKALSPNP